MNMMKIKIQEDSSKYYLPDEVIYLGKRWVVKWKQVDSKIKFVVGTFIKRIKGIHMQALFKQVKGFTTIVFLAV